ncbi:MAG: GAF domain-containing protein [Deltaproteobacteria bacterium]|nr:GAF domain-containing protein [Deltaproteobacteria bacterium]
MNKRDRVWGRFESVNRRRMRETRARLLAVERESGITLEFLHLVNANPRTLDLIRAVVTFFQRQSGCEAVGVRLRDGDDYPYHEARGFPEEFVKLENRLCDRDAGGAVRRDAAGNPLIECMCGNVICGRTDPKKPFFTTGGSFWTNGTTALLASTTEADRQSRTRNRCNGEGYESVALVPLRVGGERIGLLQLNDRRRGMFQPATIALWERLAGHLAVAIARSRAEEELGDVNRRLRAMAEVAQRENRELALGNRILETFVRETGNPLFEKALSIVLEGLASRHGVFGYIDETGDLVCPTMSRLLDECDVAGKCIRYPPRKWKGLWSRALLEKRTFFSNEPAVVPAGHVPIRRNIATPILFQGEVIGLFNLANKDSDYSGDDGEMLESLARRVAPVLYAWIQKDLRERERTAAERALLASETRFRLLSDTAGRLLATENPQQVVEGLCREVMTHLDCDAFFNFLVDPAAGRLRLNACAGIPEGEATRLEWLDFGVAVCGCVARDGRRINAEDILHTADPRTDLVRSYGIQAYCCHPLLAQGRTIGTLSFGTRSRPRFSAEDVAVMKTVADQVAVAMQRVQAQQDLQAANARLLESDRRKNDFLAVLSHELRNPLAPITNSLYVLQRAEPGGDQARRAREVIARQVRHLTHLIDDLLDVTRITRNKIQLQRRRIDLGDVVRRTVEDQRSLFQRAEVRLEADLPAAPLWVDADATRVAQIVGNLLQNAAKFTAQGGTTHVRLQPDPVRGQAVLRVADTGVGMAPETLAGLFQPFMQAGQTLDRSLGGLGLGLALVKGLVELHGGEVGADSKGLGKGAEFVVRLPLDPAPPAEAVAGRTSSPPLRRRVLVIEDNVDAAETLRDALELGGHDVAVAYNGPDGLARAKLAPPEVVLCDIGLPGMDGFDVARAFRDDERLRSVFLVALSGYAQPEDLRRAAEAGFQRHLAKPPSFEKLDELLGNIRP